MVEEGARVDIPTKSIAIESTNMKVDRMVSKVAFETLIPWVKGRRPVASLKNDEWDSNNGILENIVPRERRCETETSYRPKGGWNRENQDNRRHATKGFFKESITLLAASRILLYNLSMFSSWLYLTFNEH
jgi:hypothetical protein